MGEIILNNRGPGKPAQEEMQTGHLRGFTAEPIAPKVKSFLIFAVMLAVFFIKPLIGLARLSLQDNLYSHLFLVPIISLYLVWSDRRKLTWRFEPARIGAGFLWAFGAAAIAFYWIKTHNGWRPAVTDSLSLLMLAFVSAFSGGAAWFLGRKILGETAFPLAFLVFMIPLPEALLNFFISFLQHNSAGVAYLFLKWSGMPVFRDGMTFTVPGVTFGVASECSGIRSSFVLFITGLLAAHLFLRKSWSKLIFAAAIIPLGIFRNAFRIFTLAQLAVHVSPKVLDSAIHHQGGPVFFAISLVPFFLIIWLLRKFENRQNELAFVGGN